MATNLERYRGDLEKLIKLGEEMEMALGLRALKSQGLLEKEHEELAKKLDRSFEKNYQRWYSEASAVIKQLMPDRSAEFTYLYHGDGKRKTIDAMTYHIQDWLNGVQAGDHVMSGKKSFNDFAIVANRFQTQSGILKAVQSRFESSLFDIAQVVRADLFDSELDAARELARNGFLRGAGAIAGVVIEKHLSQVCKNHNVVTRGKHPTINDFTEVLKTSGVLDIPTWRQVQRLGDIRNLCDHNKHREPTADEVGELIDGTEKLCKTVF